MNQQKFDKITRWINKDKTSSRGRLLHLIRRFLERHNINLSLGDLESIQEQCTKANRVYVDKHGQTYKVKVKDIEVYVVKEQGIIKTVLPKENNFTRKEKRRKNA